MQPIFSLTVHLNANYSGKALCKKSSAQKKSMDVIHFKLYTYLNNIAKEIGQFNRCVGRADTFFLYTLWDC